MSRRVDNWPATLDRFIDAYRTRAFTWGAFDCLMTAAECCFVLTRVDPAAAYRGTYDTEEGAEAIIKEAGGWSKLIASCAKSAGLRRIPTALARRGDIVTCRKDANQLKKSAGGICLGSVAAFPTFKGWEFLPMKACHRQAWRVD